MLDSDSDNEDSETIARIAILKEAAKIPKSPPNEPIKQLV